MLKVILKMMSLKLGDKTKGEFLIELPFFCVQNYIQCGQYQAATASSKLENTGKQPDLAYFYTILQDYV